MGISMWHSSCSGSFTVNDPNPNPKNFKIEYIAEINDYLVVYIIYPDCTNYGGRKILVYKNMSRAVIERAVEIDPHFINNNDLEPIARFRPTMEGWREAVQYAQSIKSNREKEKIIVQNYLNISKEIIDDPSFKEFIRQMKGSKKG